MNAFFKSQFNYCPLIWMCCNRSLTWWVQRYASDSIHHQNIRFLVIEMFKVFKGISLQIAKEIFQFRDAMPYQLRKQTDFQISFVHSVSSGTESIRFLRPKILEMLTHEIIKLENFKVGLSPSKKYVLIDFNKNPFKKMKNALYFLWEALFFLGIFFFVLPFWLCSKITWLERYA